MSNYDNDDVTKARKFLSEYHQVRGLPVSEYTVIGCLIDYAKVNSTQAAPDETLINELRNTIAEKEKEIDSLKEEKNQLAQELANKSESKKKSKQVSSAEPTQESAE